MGITACLFIKNNYKLYWHHCIWNFQYMYKLLLKQVLVFMGLFALCCMFYFQKYDDTSTSIVITSPSYNRSVTDFPKKRFDKFIFHKMIGSCSGLGNQMLRIATLYGMGLYPNVNRTPGIAEPKNCLVKYVKEFSETFPNVVKLVEFAVGFSEVCFLKILITGFK